MNIPSFLPLVARIRSWRLNPYQVLALGFAGLIFFGACLLTTPLASRTETTVSFLDALFTSTSAVCVTGLVVVDTGTTYSVFGQMVVIFLIQAGGLGVMTVATLFAVLSGKRIMLRERMLIQEATNQIDLSGVVRLVLYIVKATFVIEFIGGTILAIRFFMDYGPIGIYYGYWHSISAFCNAGFDLLGDYKSLTGYVDDWTVNLTICFLIIFGGIGFPVIADVLNFRYTKRLTVHTKIVLTATLFLIVFGSVFIFMAEYDNAATLASLDLSGKIQASFFQSVTARTAGYNTLDIGAMREASLMLLIIWMFVGASPSSMGGGVKTSTVTILIAVFVSQIIGKNEPSLFGRTIPQQTIYKAGSVVLVSMVLVMTATIAMSFTESFSLFRILFDVVSGFGTVGLTTGITPSLTPHGKLWLILTMYAGRVGTMTLFMALTMRIRQSTVKYPDGKFLVG